MAAIDPIQRAIDWIEANLRAQITPEDAAREAGFSVYHFCRLFSSKTGLPVMQFITQRRLRHAAYEISQGKRIIEAAYDYGFDSASGFTRAFKREFGASPRKYARSAHPLPPGKIILKELKHIMIHQKLIQRALDAWDCAGDAQPLIHSSGARSENTFLIGESMLHVRESRAPLALSMAVEETLHKNRLPSLHTIPTRGGADILELDGLFFRLTDRLTGEFYPAQAMYDDLNRPRAVGQALSRLHMALEPLQTLPELSRCDLLRTTLDWSLPAAARAMKLPDSFIRRFSEAITRLFPSLPVCPIHRNPTPDAFLFSGGQLTGYTHFDMTEINIRLFDICYAATAILSETLHRLPDETVNRWPEVLQAIANGYDSVSPLTAEEKEALPYAVCAIQMICTAFFSSKEQFAELAKINIQMTQKIIGWLLP